MEILKPNEILQSALEKGEAKAKGNVLNLFLLGIAAGAFIAFAAEGANMAAFNLFAEPTTYGLGKILSGSVFTTGLILVLLAGGELFTGNVLMIGGVVEKRFSLGKMLRNWGIVYVGNLVGAIFIAYMIAQSGLLHSGDSMLGAVTLKIASGKVHLSFIQALYLGIMCNWLVCLAVWLSYGGKTAVDKVVGIFFPIWLFVTSGFEHSVANMYYIPVGILIKNHGDYAQVAGLSAETLNELTWQSFFVNNLLPVTLGNIIGGGVFVMMFYWIVYRKKATMMK